MPKTHILQVAQQSIDFSQLLEKVNSFSEEVKVISAKFRGSKYVDCSIASMSSVPSSYSLKSSASIGTFDPAAAKDVSKNVSELFHDPKSGKFFQSWYNERKYDFTVNLAK